MNFTVLEKRQSLFGELFYGLSEDERREAEYILESLCDMSDEEGCEVALALYDKILVIRIFDGGRYVFPFPVPLSDDVDTDMMKAALLRLADYTVRELIPLYMTDVDRDNLGLVTDLFGRVSAAVYEDDEDLFTLEVENECPREPIGRVGLGEVYLDEIRDEDAGEYLALAFDKETSRLYGYDLKADIESIDAEGHLELMRGERAAGVSLSLGIYVSEGFVGEATLFGFNYRGVAEVAIRIIPSERKKGYGTRALALLVELAKKIGLKEIKTWVKKENLPSIKMTEKHMRPVTEVGGQILYYRTLTDEQS